MTILIVLIILVGIIFLELTKKKEKYVDIFDHPIRQSKTQRAFEQSLNRKVIPPTIDVRGNSGRLTQTKRIFQTLAGVDPYTKYNRAQGIENIHDYVGQNEYDDLEFSTEVNQHMRSRAKTLMYQTKLDGFNPYQITQAKGFNSLNPADNKAIDMTEYIKPRFEPLRYEEVGEGVAVESKRMNTGHHNVGDYDSGRNENFTKRQLTKNEIKNKRKDIADFGNFPAKPGKFPRKLRYNAIRNKRTNIPDNDEKNQEIFTSTEQTGLRKKSNNFFNGFDRIKKFFTGRNDSPTKTIFSNLDMKKKYPKIYEKISIDALKINNMRENSKNMTLKKHRFMNYDQKHVPQSKYKVNNSFRREAFTKNVMKNSLGISDRMIPKSQVKTYYTTTNMNFDNTTLLRPNNSMYNNRRATQPKIKVDHRFLNRNFEDTTLLKPSLNYKRRNIPNDYGNKEAIIMGTNLKRGKKGLIQFYPRPDQFPNFRK